MKKIFLLASAIVGLFLTSCQQENLEPVAGKGQVTFTIEAPAALQTKAIADGLNVNELIYEVWITGATPNQKDLSNATRLYQARTDMVQDGDRMKANITLDLVNDQNFTVLFWAQKSGIDVYNTDCLNAVTYKPNTPEGGYAYAANDNRLDAFYAKAFVSDGATSTPTVTLHRPFAQVNLCTLISEEATKNYTIALEQSKMTLATVPTTFNVANSEVDGEMEMSFVYNDVPSDPATITVNGKPYHYAGMNYVFAGDNITLTYDIKTLLNGNVSVEVNNTIANVPLQENHRTNIVGNLLTSKNDFEIIVDAAFYEPANNVGVWDGSSVSAPAIDPESPSTIVINNAEELAWLAAFVNGQATLPTSRAAIAEGYTVLLAADIDLGNNPWTPIGYNPNDVAGNETYFTGKFDGQGHSIKNLKIDVKDQGGVGFFGAVHNATIQNVTFENVFVKAVESENDPANTSGAEGKKEYIAGGHIGAVAGYDAKSGTVAFENVHVKGLVKIEGETRAAQGQRVGGIIGGRSSSKYSFKNVSVIGTEGSYIKGYCSTAGVVGHNQDAATFENVTTDIDVYAVTFGAGGIAGIARQSSVFTNCVSKGNITLDASKTQLSSYSANYPYRVGGIVGCWSDSKTGVLTLTNCSYEGTLTSIDKDGNSPESFDYAGYVGRGYTLKNCAGSTVSVNDVNYVQAYDDVYGFYIVGGVYEIGNVVALKGLATKVNADDTFEGKTVKLIANLDLKNENWTPIGYWKTFNGTFDGQGYTISNLKHHGTEEDCYVGLFGYTENATLKNLTINNVDLKLVANGSWAGGHMGALVGNIEGETVIENINVTGLVKLEGDLTMAGAGRIGGVVGGNTCKATLKNVVVNASEGSFVQGNNSIGGIAGQLQGEISFENCSSNINVSAQQFYAGGIIGLTAENTTFTNCSASGDVSVLAGREGNANDAYRVGAIAGGWDDDVDASLVLTGCSYTGELYGNTVKGSPVLGFDCDGYVGRGYSAAIGAKVIVNGDVYEYKGDGVYTCGQKITVTTADAFLAAIATENAVVCINSTEAGLLFTKRISIAKGVTIKGNGAPIKNDWASYLFVNQTTLNNVTFENVNFTNNTVLEMAYAEGTVTFKNCVFSHVRGNQSLHFDGKPGAKVILNNCTLYGRNMLATSLDVVEFNNCAFRESTWNTEQGNKGVGTGWSGVNMWGKYQFNNCEFDAACTCNVKTEGVEATFNNCSINGGSAIENVVKYASDVNPSNATIVFNN